MNEAHHVGRGLASVLNGLGDGAQDDGGRYVFTITERGGNAGEITWDHAMKRWQWEEGVNGPRLLCRTEVLDLALDLPYLVNLLGSVVGAKVCPKPTDHERALLAKLQRLSDIAKATE